LSQLRKEREMTTRKKKTTGKGDVKKPKLRKETIKDLDVKSKGRDVKGGRFDPYKNITGLPTIC
jgi:hypothetical protein